EVLVEVAVEGVAELTLVVVLGAADVGDEVGAAVGLRRALDEHALLGGGLDRVVVGDAAALHARQALRAVVARRARLAAAALLRGDDALRSAAGVTLAAADENRSEQPLAGEHARRHDATIHLRSPLAS